MRAIARASGQVCLTIGVIITLFICYLLWGSGRAGQAQRQFAAQLERAWHEPVGIGERMPADPVHLVTPTRRLITLITCDPAWTGTHRVIVTGVLTAVSPRAAGSA